MKRLLIAYAFALVGVLLPVLPAQAGIPIYSGNLQVQNGANLTFLNGASGCLLVNNGTVYTAACPIGTVAFSASSPFTVTGVGPYVIGCPTCFTTTGGTITGATTFSGTVTVGALLTQSSTNGTISFPGGSNSELKVVNFGSPNAGLELQNTATGGGHASLFVGDSTNGFSNMFFVYDYGTSTRPFSVALATGNATFLGQVTATQYNVGSKRAWKQDIQPLSFDALQVLHNTDFAAFRYRRGHGNPQAPHIGIIADDSPSVLSGKNHDHLDIEALATVDAKAILELHQQVTNLFIGCAVLVLCFLVTLGVALTKES
jgi:hypothetical protein